MGNTRNDPATEVPQNLIGHATTATEVFMTKEFTTTATGRNDLDRENEPSPPSDTRDEIPAPIVHLIHPDPRGDPTAREIRGCSDPSIAAKSQSASAPGVSLPTLSSGSGTPALPMSDPPSLADGTAPSYPLVEPCDKPIGHHLNAKEIDDGPYHAQEGQDAVEQAEEGSIIVDSDDMATDAGYESDGNTAASTSLADSVRDYIFENGRRYHRFREGRYNFPNDDVEYVLTFWTWIVRCSWVCAVC